MRFLVKKTPDSFIKSVNDDICSILNRHFDSLYPQYDYEEEMEKLSIPVELIDKEKEYDIKAELPGVKKEDLDIEIENNYITISAKKELTKNKNKNTVNFQEVFTFLKKLIRIKQKPHLKTEF